ncbi:ribonuclease H-like domain-containing protein [Tanacetum coccineum]
MLAHKSIDFVGGLENDINCLESQSALECASAGLAIVLQKAKQIQDFGPTSGIRASRGTLMLMKHHTMKMHQKMKEEYDIWDMEMEHYLEYIDNDVWKVIQNGNSKKRISIGKDGVVRILPPVSTAKTHAVEKERKDRTILLMVIPKEHLRRFHGIDDEKEIWEAIRTSLEGLEKGYDRFQQLLSQLEAHGAEVSTKDANHKFLRSLPPAWSNLAMTMRTKPDVDTLSIDDLYNNLRVFEQELTSTSKSSASAQNKDLKDIPSRYIRPEIELDEEVLIDESLHIPVIDISKLAVVGQPGYDDELENLHVACRDWGFFQVTYRVNINFE